MNVAKLRDGAALHCLIHAVIASKWPDFDNEVSWELLNYSRQDSEGCYGTVSFVRGGRVVAAFYDESLPPQPLAKMFKGCPAPLRAYAKGQTLKYLYLDEPDAPSVTAAFWSDARGALVGARPWARLVKDGAHLIADELLPDDKALARWAKDGDLTKTQIQTVRDVWARRKLTPADRKTLGLRRTDAVRLLIAGARL